MKAQEALARIVEHREIFHDEMISLMRQIMSGEVTPVMIAAIITGLRVKKETIGEISAAAQVMRDLSTKVVPSKRSHLVDTCGTGGDGAQTFNISTAAMFVAAAAGARVAKHGGRSVSSQSGSADVLEALGVNISLTPEQVGQCIDEVGIGFMFAPNHHSAMKHAAPVRRELGVRTLFNILGPLTNPAGADSQVLGVFHPDLVGIQVHVLQQLGSARALTVFGREGLDEISISGETLVGELKNGRIDEYSIHPQQFKLPVQDASAPCASPTSKNRKRCCSAHCCNKQRRRARHRRAQRRRQHLRQRRDRDAGRRRRAGFGSHRLGRRARPAGRIRRFLARLPGVIDAFTKETSHGHPAD
jgi:anthranilate phosphoribosyltransferase